MSRNLRLSSDVELMAIMQRMRSPRSEMRDAESAHRVNSNQSQARTSDVRESHKLDQPGSTPGPASTLAAARPSAAPGLPPSSQRTSAVAAPIYPLVALCRQAGLAEPVPEFRFHPHRKWRFDYAWPLHRLALEVDGGVWTQGRHTRGSGFVGDLLKFNAATLLGWRVLRYTPQQLGQAITDLRIALAGGAA